MRNTKPHEQKGRVKMKSERIMILVWADLNKRKIYVPRKLMERVHILNSAEAQLYFTYRNRYPDFEVISLG